MMAAAILRGFCLLIAIAVMASASPFLRATAASHDIAAFPTVNVLVFTAPVDETGHGHSHDDDESGGAHLPGHGPEHKDHSHVTLGFAAAPPSLTAPQGRILLQWDEDRPGSNPSFLLDRPPCPSFVA